MVSAKIWEKVVIFIVVFIEIFTKLTYITIMTIQVFPNYMESWIAISENNTFFCPWQYTRYLFFCFLSPFVCEYFPVFLFFDCPTIFVLFSIPIIIIYWFPFPSLAMNWLEGPIRDDQLTFHPNNNYYALIFRD